ncbi:HEAT repeat domain-containing protein, partial [Streptomyces sp. NPDC004579]|uniref:HEAT repeat domain-containing protein n=1 Tax=Streptomyces sp. NPDC004579 TaxID=3154667 RepID=UPI0033B4A109
PVAPYAVPVDGFLPVGGPSRHLGEVHPEQVATAGTREAAPVAMGSETTPAGTTLPHGAATESPATPRLLQLLSLAEEEPELATIAPYLIDSDPVVRRTAVTVLTETVPPGTGPALAAALVDADAGVREAAAGSLGELVETLPADNALREGLAVALSADDPVVRAAALDVLRALRLGDAELFRGSLSDSSTAVRIEAVRALVSVDATEEVARAAGDPSREVRVTIARALGTAVTGRLGDTSPVGSGPVRARSVLAELIADPDALVRAAAYAALAATGCPPPLDALAVAALSDAAWQVRAGSATALSAADPGTAVPALAKALADPNADVRKAAVLALTRHRATEDTRAALATATTDTDADVRAYATRAL